MQTPYALQAPSPGYKNVLAALIVFGAFTAYLNSFSVPFLFDDLEGIIHNPTIRDIWSFNWMHPPASSLVGGRPITNLSFAVNYNVGGMSVFGYHLVNFGIHILSGLLIFFWLCELLSRPEMPERIARQAVHLGFVCSALWICHPVGTFAVTYIAQRSEALMSLLYLTTIYCFWKWMGPDTNKRWPYIAIAISYCGMACKEGMATVPIMVLLIDRTFFSKTFSDALKQRKWFYAGLASSWLILFWLYSGTQGRGVGFGQGITWSKYALTETRVVLLYLKLVFFPSPLIFDYAYTPYHANVEEIPYLIGLIALLGWTCLMLWKRPLIGFGCAWFFILLAPSSSVIPLASEPMGENRMYLAALGPLVLFTILMYYWLRSIAWVFLASAWIAGVVYTQRRNEDCSSSVKIWSDTVAKIPQSPRAHVNLACSLLFDQRPTEADKEFDEALLLNPGWALIYAYKGDVQLQIGKRSDAEKWYRDAVAADPSLWETWRKLGGILQQSGRNEEAISSFRRAVDIHPEDAASFVGLGNCAISLGNVPEAIKYYEHAMELNPELAVAHSDLGFAFIKAGRSEQAIEELLTAVMIDPGQEKALCNLGSLYAMKSDFVQSIESYLAALRIAPNDIDARINLANVYQLSGQSELAEVSYRDAIRRAPLQTRAKLQLDALLKGRKER